MAQTDRHIHGHGNLLTNSAQCSGAELVKMKILRLSFKQLTPADKIKGGSHLIRNHGHIRKGNYGQLLYSPMTLISLQPVLARGK